MGFDVVGFELVEVVEKVIVVDIVGVVVSDIWLFGVSGFDVFV